MKMYDLIRPDSWPWWKRWDRRGLSNFCLTCTCAGYKKILPDRLQFRNLSHSAALYSGQNTWTWRPELTVAPVHPISSPWVVVATAETVVAKEEEIMAGEAEEEDVVGVDDNKDNHSRKNHPTLRSIKTRIKPQSAKYVGNLATLLISVGTGHHRLEVIHLGVVSSSPEVAIEVHAGQAVVYKEDEAEGSPQWLTTSHME